MLSSLHESTIRYNSQFSSQAVEIFWKDLLAKIARLPIRFDQVLKMVDFDDTLWNSNRRFDVDKALENHRWDSAYPYIAVRYGSEKDPSWFNEFVSLLQVHHHLLDTDHFYEPRNPDHVILTAGDLHYQRKKIESAGYAKSKRVLVRDAKNKPLAILSYILKLWYIPGKIEFIDDRIDNFSGMDELLAKILQVSVVFQKAIPNLTENSVELIQITKNKVEWIVGTNDVIRYLS